MMSEIIYSKKLKYGNFEIFNDKPVFDCLHVHQTHSTDIVDVNSLDRKSDGIIFENNINRPIAIKTADCMPIVLYGESKSIFLHAGWSGLAKGILETDEVKKISPAYIYIGPSIHVCHFEVTEEFRDHFKNSSHFLQKNDKLYFDLHAQACDILTRQFPKAEIEVDKNCTHCDNKFNSYRRDKTDKRNWNIWTL